MRALVSDDIGLIKDISFTSNESQLVCNESGANHVVAIATVSKSPYVVMTSRVDGTLESFELNEEQKSWVPKSKIDLEEAAISIHAIEDKILVLCESNVSVIIADAESIRLSKTYPLPEGPYSVVALMRSLADERPARVIAAMDRAPPVVIDFEKGQIVWKGKNAPDTPLGLTSVFHTERIISLSPSVFVASDSTGRLRFYDTAVQKKPILEYSVFQAFNITNNYTGTTDMGQTRPIKQLELTLDDSTLVLGDTHGSVIGLDLSKLLKDRSLFKIPVPDKEANRFGTNAHLDYCRKLIPMKFSFPGVMGAVRSIAVTDAVVYVVTAGRYAYAFDIKSKGKKFQKMFLKQKLTCCIPIESVTLTKGQEDRDEDIDSEGDDNDLVQDLLDAVDEKDDSGDVFMSKSKRRRLKKGAASR